jgi:hypothetical protein
VNLNIKALGLSLGLVWGLTILLATWWLLIMDSSGMTISGLKKIYFGYSFSWVGGLIGLLWGFIDGFISGVVIARLYNLFNRKNLFNKKS